MYETKPHGMATLVIDGNGNGVALFYGSSGKENAELFVRAKKKAEEVFTRDGKPVPQEY